MKKAGRKIVEKYKGHEIRLQILHTMGRVYAQRKWVFEIVITRLQPPFHSPDVVLKMNLTIRDTQPVDVVLMSVFVDSMVLCDTTLK
jgi:hypothetical protein